ncbi:hypothetical protein RFI_28710 [Reticulomyxa filosa]|uniref:Uncharacterized protein n=1 Tax=Reticulomyxa filosa TaxID=46433 RepID=X6M3X2_RETFI|nr:hypothetical protein RFI_28710 [Reticulomyxa filosa]|eukprot:ETO08678.1 hypothetical protein RFI_28710 [Reticulomyxa filosa]
MQVNSFETRDGKSRIAEEMAKTKSLEAEIEIEDETQDTTKTKRQSGKENARNSMSHTTKYQYNTPRPSVVDDIRNPKKSNSPKMQSQPLSGSPKGKETLHAHFDNNVGIAHIPAASSYLELTPQNSEKERHNAISSDVFNTTNANNNGNNNNNNNNYSNNNNDQQGNNQPISTKGTFLDPKNAANQLELNDAPSVGLSLSKISLDMATQHQRVIAEMRANAGNGMCIYSTTAKKKRKSFFGKILSDNEEEEEDEEQMKTASAMQRGEQSRNKLVDMLGVPGGREKATKRLITDNVHTLIYSVYVLYRMYNTFFVSTYTACMCHDSLKKKKKYLYTYMCGFTYRLVSLHVLVTFLLLGGTFVDMVLLLFVPIDLLISAICMLFLFQIPAFSKAYRFLCRPLEKTLCFFVGREEYQLIRQKNKATKHNLAIIEEYKNRKSEYLKQVSLRSSAVPSNAAELLKDRIGDRGNEVVSTTGSNAVHNDDGDKQVHPSSHTNSMTSQPFLPFFLPIHERSGSPDLMMIDEDDNYNELERKPAHPSNDANQSKTIVSSNNTKDHLTSIHNVHTLQSDSSLPKDKELLVEEEEEEEEIIADDQDITSFHSANPQKIKINSVTIDVNIMSRNTQKQAEEEENEKEEAKENQEEEQEEEKKGTNQIQQLQKKATNQHQNVMHAASAVSNNGTPISLGEEQEQLDGFVMIKQEKNVDFMVCWFKYDKGSEKEIPHAYRDEQKQQDNDNYGNKKQTQGLGLQIPIKLVTGHERLDVEAAGGGGGGGGGGSVLQLTNDASGKSQPSMDGVDEEESLAYPGRNHQTPLTSSRNLKYSPNFSHVGDVRDVPSLKKAETIYQMLYKNKYIYKYIYIYLFICHSYYQMEIHYIVSFMFVGSHGQLGQDAHGKDELSLGSIWQPPAVTSVPEQHSKNGSKSHSPTQPQKNSTEQHTANHLLTNRQATYVTSPSSNDPSRRSNTQGQNTHKFDINSYHRSHSNVVNTIKYIDALVNNQESGAMHSQAKSEDNNSKMDDTPHNQDRKPQKKSRVANDEDSVNSEEIYVDDVAHFYEASVSSVVDNFPNKDT